MGQTTYDWSLSRVYGYSAPILTDDQGVAESNDAYGNKLLTVEAGAKEHNLARNAMYSLEISGFDGYCSLIDGYDTAAEGALEVEGLESSVTDATASIVLRDGQERFITTTSKRHVLSYKLPDAAGGAPLGLDVKLRVIKKCSRTGR